MRRGLAQGARPHARAGAIRGALVPGDADHGDVRVGRVGAGTCGALKKVAMPLNGSSS